MCMIRLGLAHLLIGSRVIWAITVAPATNLLLCFCLIMFVLQSCSYVFMPTGRYFQMSSFSESNAFKHASNSAGKFVRYNKRQLARTYPAGTRVNSSNYDPVPMWNSGCQIGERGHYLEDIFV